jgi:addiction module HigA family antidote
MLKLWIITRGVIMANKIRPIHPGEILREELEELNYSANRFASLLHVPVNRITHILNGQRSITADTALRLAKFFGTTPEFWLNLQNAYDLKITLQKSGKKIDHDVARRKAA